MHETSADESCKLMMTVEQSTRHMNGGRTALLILLWLKYYLE